MNPSASSRVRAPRSASAFTLIELLTVIAIIGILAAIIIPVTGKVRENARTTQCGSNMRQIAAALLLYGAENKNTLPAISTTWGPSINAQGTWLYVLWPYAGYARETLVQDPTVLRATAGLPDHRNIFICPTTQQNKTATQTFGNFAPHGWLFSYGLNALTDTWANGQSPYTTPISMGKVAAPSRTVMVNENSLLMGTEYGYRGLYGLLPHGGGANFAFYDGHIERRPKATIPNLAEPATRGFWTGQ